MNRSFLFLFLAYFIFHNTLTAQITSGSFAAAVPFSTGNNASINAATGDLDGDGMKDVVVVNEAIGKISIFRNTSTAGNISFAARIDSAVSVNLGFAHLTDMDGDGKLDIVVSCGTSSMVAVYRNLSTPGNILLAAKQTFALASSNAWGMWVKDLDGDNLPDVVASNSTGNTFNVLRNTSTPGTISFANFVSFTSAALSSPSQVISADLDADAKNDLVFFNNSGNNIVIIRNTTTTPGTITFNTTAVTLAANTGPHRGDVADVDGDGKPDIATSNYFSQNTSIYRNISTMGTISFASKVDFGAASAGMHASLLRDLDLDGKPELIQTCGSTSGNSRVSVFRNYARSGTLALTSMGTRIDYTTGTEPRGLAIDDLDGDEIPELITLNYSSTSFSVLRSQIKPAYGLVMHYMFSGNAGDSSGFGNHGTASGVTVTTDRKNKMNSAYSFDGSTLDYISVPANISYNPTTNQNMLFTCWFKPGTSTTNLSRRLWNMQDGSNRNYDLAFDYLTQKLVYINFNGTSSAVQFNSTRTFTAGTWYHVAIRIDSANNTTMFINGALEMSSTNTINRPVNPTFQIGRHASQGWNFIGDLDEVKVYTKHVADTGIASLYNNEAPYRTYYSKSAGNLNLLATWGTNADGSGTAPLSFDSSSTTYVVVNNPNPQLGGTLKITGTNAVLVLGNGANTFNLIVNASDTLSGDSVYVHDNITLTAMGTFSTPKLNSSATGNVQYISSLPQSIAPGSYGNLVITSSTKTLTGTTVVRNNFGMASSLNTGSYAFTLGVSAASTGALSRSGGTIIGKFTRWFANTINSGSTGLLPVGTATKYLPFQVEFSTAPTTGGTITAEFIASNPGNVGLPVTDFSSGFLFLDKASPEGYWKITSAISTGTFKASATATNFAGVNAYADLRLLRRNTNGAWTAPPTSVPGTGSNTSVVVARTGLTALEGEYGIGGDQSQNPLPVKLSTFAAQRLNTNQCVVSWTTVSEINAEKFIVQRSTDLRNWEDRAKVKAQGNSSQKISYAVQDDISKLSQIVYYRLLQLDYNGDRYIGKTVSVILDNSLEKNRISVYPNPASDEIVITGLADAQGVIYNSFGQTVKIFSSALVPVSDLPAGIYFIRNGNEVVRFIKQ